MPFSIDEFFHIFGRYNEAIWPLQFLAYVAGATSVAALLTPGRGQTGIILGVLAAMWAINGIGYHWTFFASINPIARLFAVLFFAQAVALAYSAYAVVDLRFTVGRNAVSITAVLLIGFAAIAYPIWGWAAGHRYPRVPMFGVAPCPTTIFTLGMLLLGTWTNVRWLFVVPLLWAGVGGSAAILLSVPQDYGLIAAALLALAITLPHKKAWTV